MFLLFLAACGSPPPEPPPPPPVPGGLSGATGEVLATVDGREIDKRQIAAMKQTMAPASIRQIEEAPAAMKQVVESLVIRDALYQAAVDAKLHEEEEVKNAIAMAAREVLASAYLTRKGNEAATPDAVKGAYDSQLLKYGRPQAFLLHFFVQELDLANQLKTRIDGGEPFQRIAAEYALHPDEKRAGGQHGWVSGPPIPALAEAFADAEIGIVNGPIESNYGFHLFTVTQRRDKVPFEEARVALEQELWEKALQTTRDEVKLAAEITFPSDKPPTPPAGGPATPPPSPAAPAPGNTAAAEGETK